MFYWRLIVLTFYDFLMSKHAGSHLCVDLTVVCFDKCLCKCFSHCINRVAFFIFLNCRVHLCIAIANSLGICFENVFFHSFAFLFS